MRHTSIPLAKFYEEMFRPLVLRSITPESAELYRCSIQWLGKVLGRPPQLADLNELTLRMALEQLALAGLGRVRLKTMRQKWLRFWEYAAQLGWLPAIEAKPPLPRPTLQARVWTAPEPPEGTLLRWYRKVFRPELAPQIAARKLTEADSAVNYFHDFCGGLVPIDQVSMELLDDYHAWLGTRPLGAKSRERYRGWLRRIMRAHNPERFPKHGGCEPQRVIVGEHERERAALAPERRPRRKLPIPVGEPGTLLQFYSDCYVPEQLRFATEQHRDSLYAIFRELKLCFGRHVRLEDLGRQFVTDYTVWLDEAGNSQRTIHNKLTRLQAVWRYAHELEMAPPVPTRRRWRHKRETPDAWSIDELSRLIAAADQLVAPPIAGVPAGKFWRAILLVGWYTALRRGALLKLRPGDVLADGWLDVPAGVMKNGNGQRFKLGDDALEALAAIAEPERERLFPAKSDARFLGQHWKRLIALAGIEKSRRPNGHFHKLRRTAITHTCAQAGMPAAIALAGHSAQYVTLRYLDPRYLPNNDATAWLPRLDLAGGEQQRVA